MRSPFILLPAVVVVVSSAMGEPPRMPAGSAAAVFKVSPAPPPATPAATDAPLMARVTPAVVSVFPAIILEEDGSSDDPLSRYFGRDRSGPGGTEKKGPQEQ